MTAIYIGIFIISIFCINQYYGSLFVPMTIIAVTWSLFPAIASFGVLGIKELCFETHAYILLSYAVFFLFSISNSKRTKHESNLINDNEESQIDDHNYVRYGLLFCGNLIVAIWLCSKLGQTLSIISNYGFVYLRNIYEENFSTSTIVNIIYNWFAKPFVVGSCAIFCMDVLQKRNRRQIKVGIIILINVILDTIIFAARATIVKLVIYFFFALFFCKRRKYSKKQVFLIILIVISLMAVIVFMTGERMSESYSSFSFLDSIAMYYVAPFALLDYYIRNPDFSLLQYNHLTFGAGTFGFIYNIIRSAFYVLFGFNYNGSDYILQLVTQKTVKVGERVSINSACTANYVFLRDFGPIGIIIGFALMAYVVETLRKRYDKCVSVRNGALYITMLYSVFRLSMSYDFLTPATFFSILFILLCTKKPRYHIVFGKMKLN